MRSPDLTLEQAAALLHETMPDTRVSGVERMSGGEVTGAHLVTLADGSAPIVLKVYAEGNGWVLKREVFVYRLLRRNGITTIPRLLGGGAARHSPIGRPYLLMSRLAGENAEDLIPNASADEVAAIYRQMGAILRRIHGIRLDAFGHALTTAVDAETTNEAFMRRVFRERVTTHLDHGGDPTTVEAAEKYLEDHAGLFALCATPVLLHGDFHEGNVLVERAPCGPLVTGVVDVENALAGDPVADIARLCDFSIRGDRAKLDAFFEGYGSVPEHFEARRKLYQLIQDFELLEWFRRIGERRYRDDLLADIRKISASD